MSSSEIVLPFEIGFDELMLAVHKKLPLAFQSKATDARPGTPILVEQEVGVVTPTPSRTSSLGGRVLGRDQLGIVVTGFPKRSDTLSWELNLQNIGTHLVKRVEIRGNDLVIVVDAECKVVERINAQER